MFLTFPNTQLDKTIVENYTRSPHGQSVSSFFCLILRWSMFNLQTIDVQGTELNVSIFYAVTICHAPTTGRGSAPANQPAEKVQGAWLAACCMNVVKKPSFGQNGAPTSSSILRMGIW